MEHHKKHHHKEHHAKGMETLKKSHQKERSPGNEHHSNMIDNRMVSDNHQQGIERVKQRPGSMPVGQKASMEDGWRHGRHSEKMVPKKG
jgi:hypothetical protein